MGHVPRERKHTTDSYQSPMDYEVEEEEGVENFA